MVRTAEFNTSKLRDC